jgi:eukaryotic-like serine/threonine-protein kinase
MHSLEDPTDAPTATLADTEEESHSSFGLATGTLVGRYVIVDQLGAGGMGTVYVGYDTQLARRVAIKVLRPDAHSSDAQARLLLEAQTLARLAHPNVLTVHDVGMFGDGVFVAMEYIVGQTLKAWLKERHTWRESLAVLKGAGRGLEAAHAAGIVHRDFKPANVFLGNDGRVVVGDFGIARSSDAVADSSVPSPGSLDPASARVPAPAHSPANPEAPPSSHSFPSPSVADTETGALLGTIGYMSPERAFDHRDDARSDQFSFCVTLYRALYGIPPFPYFDLASYLNSLLAPPRPPPAGSRVPAWVQAIVRRGLSYEPSDRFASMTELLSALERDPTRRRRWWALGACGVALAGIAALGVAQHRRNVRAECRVGESVIATTWGPDARAKVEAQIAGTGAPFARESATRTTRILDAYSAEWARVHREASEATLLRAEQSTTTMRDRLACLEGERDELAALVDLLARADAAVTMHAMRAAYDLPTPRTCLEPSAAHAASVLPDAPGPRARMAALRHTVAEAEALHLTGKCNEALPVAARALAEARAIPHRQSEAELLFLVAACKAEVDSDTVAVESFELAFAAAEAAGNDSLAAIGASTISIELGDSLAQPHEAERWLAIAKGIRQREGSDERADAEIMEAELSLLSGQGHEDKAVLLRDKLIALLERLYGPSHPRLAAAIANKAGDLDTLGQLDLAVTEHRRAIAMQELIFGPDAPYLSTEYNNLGFTLISLGRYEEATQAIDRALALLAPLGAENPHTVLPLTSLVTLDNRVGDHKGALTAADRGIAIVGATGESEMRYLPSLLVGRGIALLATGDAAKAREACARALQVQEAKEMIGPDQIYSDDALTCVGTAETSLGLLDQALSHLERSVAIAKHSPATDLALARFALARALTAAKRDPERARELAETALKQLRAAPGMAYEAREVQQWLEAEEKAKTAR